jgi:hypothetical protein
MFDTFHVRPFYRVNVCTLADVPDRLNGRSGLRETAYDQTEGLPLHITSASLAIAFRTPHQGLNDMTYRPEVCVCMAISYERRIDDRSARSFHTCHV